MAAGEDQSQPVVLDALIAPLRRITRCGVGALRESGQRCIEPRAPPHGVDGLETPSRNEPRSRIVGHAFLWPLIERSRESIVQRLLGEIEVA
jgi:hypothetical protein